MRVFHTTQADATTTNATLERLRHALAPLRARHAGATDFEQFEGALHALFMAAEREVLAEELERLDVNRPQLLIDGHLHHRVLRSSETYNQRRRAGDGDAYAVSVRARYGGGSAGVARRHGGGSVHAAGGDAPNAAGGGRAVSGGGQHASVEEQSGPVAQSVLGTVGSATAGVREAVARGDAYSRSGSDGGGVARRGDDADEGRGAQCQACGDVGRRQAHARPSRLSRSRLGDAECLRCRR